MSQLFAGKTLMRHDGDNFKEDSAKSLEGKVVAIYFSAHWCPPCRGFTPVLKDFYNELASTGKFEVVFVSSDKSPSDALSYMKESHGNWLYVPHGDAFVQELKTKYNVRGIPMLVIIKADGTLVDDDGRSPVQGKEEPSAEILNKWKAACGIN